MSFKIKKNKITFILPHLNGGGAERVCLTYLRKLKNNKFDISLIVFDKTTDLTNLIDRKTGLDNLIDLTARLALTVWRTYSVPA